MIQIYSGKEPLLANILIDKTIEEHKIDILTIKDIKIDCYMPRDDSLKLWEIVIRINTTGFSHTDTFYSKDCIHHGYSITYLQHLKIKGVKKLKI